MNEYRCDTCHKAAFDLDGKGRCRWCRQENEAVPVLCANCGARHHHPALAAACRRNASRLG